MALSEKSCLAVVVFQKKKKKIESNDVEFIVFCPLLKKACHGYG